MSEMIRAAIVRVRRDSDQQVVGVGFLVDAGKKTILTCAHVINAAIEDSENQVKPRSLISLDFPFLGPDKRLDARVTHFFPKKRDNTDDIALLEILDDLPAEAKAVQLAVADTYSGHEFGVYGFPVGFEDNGQYVEGKLQEKLVNKRIQAVGTSNLGYFVERGFSGSPVYDKELDAVVGMMMQVDVEPEKRVAFISSPDVIAALYPELQHRQVRQSAKSAASPTSPPSNGKWLQRVDIFISSPSDVAEEREAILRVIEWLNRLSYIRSRYVLNPLLYEKEVPPQAGDYAQMIVDRYMAVEDSYLLICLMWNRMGTPFTHPQTGEEFQSGTEYEFTIGYRANSKKGQPHLLLYRKTTEQTDVDEVEKEKVDGFFKRFEGKEATFKGLYKPFSSLGEFENMLFEHIDRILHDNPPDTTRPDTLVDPDTRPDIIEEVRRLDAAMPRECQVGRSTEVRVMICLPDSEGLRDTLPDFTEEGDLIDKRDVKGNDLAIAFPVNKATGQPERIRLMVEVKSIDFEIHEPIQEIWLSYKHNSGMILFNLVPVIESSHGHVHIVVKSKSSDGYVVVFGSGSLKTKIKPKDAPSLMNCAGTILKNVLSIPLGVLPTSNVTGYPLQKEQKFITVFSYDGDNIQLPLGATPIDFAYHIDSEIGHLCRGAKVHGRLVPLNYKLKMGDRVDIFSAKRGGPSTDWLNPNLGYVKTSHALSKIQQWLSQQPRDKQIATGRDALERELKRLGVMDKLSFEIVARLFDYDHLDDLLSAIGAGDINGGHIINRTLEGGYLKEWEIIASRRPRAAAATSLVGLISGWDTTGDVRIQGAGGLLVKLATCCNPMPGDEIIGHITRDRWVTVHRDDCANVQSLADTDQLINVSWGSPVEERYSVPIEIVAYERAGLLSEVSAVIAKENVNVSSIEVSSHQHVATLHITLEIVDNEQLAQTLAKLEQVPSIRQVGQTDSA